VTGWFRGRAVRGWSQLVVEVVLLLVALGLVQTIAERTNRRIDLTPGHALSLDPITKQVLARVTEPLQLTVFYARGQREQYAALLARLHAQNARVTGELLDLDRYPERARAYGITKPGFATVAYAGRTRIAPALPEEQLAGALLGVVRGRRQRLLLTVGHGERVPGGDEHGLGRFVQALDAENYAVEPGSLADGSVPPDTDVVVVAGPQVDFTPPELAALAGFLRGGGGVVLLLDPGALPALATWLRQAGVRLGDDFVVDRERRVLATDGLAAVVEQFRRGNPISEPPANPIESGAVLPSARSVDVEGPAPGVRAESVARTGPTSWAMRDAGRARRGEEPTRAAGDEPGPLSVIVTAEVGAGERPGRLVVVGDADFATDAYLDVLGNRDIALNAVAWAAHEDTLAGNRPARVPEIQRPLSPLVLTEAQARLLLLGVAVVEPALVLGAGLVVVGLRRRRG